MALLQYYNSVVSIQQDRSRIIFIHRENIFLGASLFLGGIEKLQRRVRKKIFKGIILILTENNYKKYLFSYPNL